MKWFINPRTLEELKKQYKTLAFKYHPDCGGNVKDMQAINNEYDILFQQLKNVHTNASGEAYQSNAQSEEKPDQFKDIINAIINFQDVKIEIIGSWLWVTGNTFPYKDTLKELSFKWSNKKAAWYFHTEPYQKRSKKSLSLDEIRKMYGTQTVDTVSLQMLAY